jgi:hypothetical protein
MKFDKVIHSKELLLADENILCELVFHCDEFALCELAQDKEILSYVFESIGYTVAHYLAELKPAWAKTAAAQDFDILNLRDYEYKPVAHFLASKQTGWLETEAVKKFDVLNIKDEQGYSVAHILSENGLWLDHDESLMHDVLKIADINGNTVAHNIATHQPHWHLTEPSKNFDILMLKNNNDVTVAHILARYNKEWMMFSDVAQKNEVLTVITTTGKPVAFELLSHPESIYHEPLLDKRVLTITYMGKLIAEHITEQEAYDIKVSTSEIALKLIEQGAAYKHSTNLPVSVGEEIFKKAQWIVEDCRDNVLKIRFAQALYSSLFHASITHEQKSLSDGINPWTDLLNLAEQQISQLLDENVISDELFNGDFFCEPGVVLVKKFLAKNNFNHLSLCIEDSDSVTPNPFY